MLLSSHFIFHLCLQTNKQCYRLLRLTNDSSSFQLVFGHEIEHALSGAGFWHQRNLVPLKYDRLTSFCCHLTGTRNWPVCHHYKHLLTDSFGMQL